jgi:hypothetical protein
VPNKVGRARLGAGTNEGIIARGLSRRRSSGRARQRARQRALGRARWRVCSPADGRARADRVDGRALSSSTSARRPHGQMCSPTCRSPYSQLGAERVSRHVDGRVNGRAAHRVDGRVAKRVGGRAWTGAWTGARRDGRVDGRTPKRPTGAPSSRRTGHGCAAQRVGDGPAQRDDGTVRGQRKGEAGERQQWAADTRPLRVNCLYIVSLRSNKKAPLSQW